MGGRLPVSVRVLTSAYPHRMNTKALSLLTLLNVYQKRHLVEILSYHSCDSQTRNAPEMDCLIRLQAQNIQQRHIVFLTGRKEGLEWVFKSQR